VVKNPDDNTSDNEKLRRHSKMGKKVALLFLSAFLAAFCSGAAMAQHSHEHGSTSPATPGMGSSHPMPMEKGAVQSTIAEGWKIGFEVMSMQAHMAMPGMKGHSQHSASASSPSHSLMLSIQDTASKEIISDAKVAYTILSPSGKKETGKLAWSGDHYGGDFNPTEKGQYQVQVMVEGGGMEREAKFTYEAK
jgi:hypothetical protein